jgi:hypothetical protein
LTFKSDGVFTAGLARDLAVGEAMASGVDINTGATFTFSNDRGIAVPPGTILTLISNTSATPIAGTFQNLPDGSLFVDHGNTFQVNYEGGDGNDLTLTRLP